MKCVGGEEEEEEEEDGEMLLGTNERTSWLASG